MAVSRATFRSHHSPPAMAGVKVERLFVQRMKTK
jgi:hypothetical protein